MLSSILNFYLVNSIFCISPKDLVEQLGLCLPRQFMVCFLWALTFSKCHKFLLCGPSFKLEFTKQVQGFLGYRKDKRGGKKEKKSICSSNTNIPNNHGYECTGCYVLACK